MERCSEGHFYDKEKYTMCPFCGVGGLDMQTKLMKSNSTIRIPPTAPVGDSDGELDRKIASVGPTHREPGVTVSLVRERIGLDPVVGWLVCIEGTEKGHDYRIHSEKNSIGRSFSMDISIDGDETISRENHAYIVYNPKNSTFRVQAGDRRGLVYLNDEVVMTYAELKPYDIIEIGRTKLSFIPFCGEHYKWA
ncbi:MAG: hypothetical protein H6Q73_52 [Firmicutes bacterium]|nr:hypothetical protein [Bacillota bacterium]